jgi:hypothetical protein
MNDTAQITMSSKQLEKVIAALDTALGVCQLVGADRKPIDLDDCYAELGAVYDDLCALAGERSESSEDA